MCRALRDQSLEGEDAGREDWSWAGMGSETPQPVAGLTGVQAVALGHMHALALVK